jgi:hypothetical protein
MVGLHYIFFVVYSYFTNTLASALLLDVWTVPLFGLGLVLLKSSIKKAQN